MQSLPFLTLAILRRNRNSLNLEMQAPSPPLAVSPLSDKRILLAEDNPINQKVALLQLSKLGFTAQTVTNGREALEAASNGGGVYALVLMDCQMPEMDGFDAARAIRKAELTSGHHIPIIAMTANAMEGDRERCIATGMDDYISKPVSLEGLKKVLYLWLRQRGGDRLMDTFTLETYPLDVPMLADLRALQVEGQPDLIGELLDLLLTVAPPLLEKIRLAGAQGDHETLYRSAHSLKGSSASVGAVALAAGLKEIEQMGRGNQLEGVTEKIAQVETEYARATQALESERRKRY